MWTPSISINRWSNKLPNGRFIIGFNTLYIYIHYIYIYMHLWSLVHIQSHPVSSPCCQTKHATQRNSLPRTRPARGSRMRKSTWLLLWLDGRSMGVSPFSTNGPMDMESPPFLKIIFLRKWSGFPYVDLFDLLESSCEWGLVGII